MQILSAITKEIKNDIYWIGFGKQETKSLTVITEVLLRELNDVLEEIKVNKDAKGLIIFSHKPGCFLAGMDVSVISSLKNEADASLGCEQGQGIFNKIEDLKIPTMALVDGVCMGGGLEMVLSCQNIIASDSSKTVFALPEVKLGVLPGFGGTYRLPRKIGLPNALPLLLQGSNLSAKKALKNGLVCKIMPRERFESHAESYLGHSFVVKKSFNETLTDVLSDNFFARKIIFQKAREKVLETTKGFYPAPLKIIDHLEHSFGSRRHTYLSNEARAFGELSQTPQSKNLQHVFFLHDGSKKLFQDTKHPKIKKSAVVGAGTMGGGIAWLLADNDQAPVLKDINFEALELGLKQSSAVFTKALKRKKMTKDEFEKKQRSITPTLHYQSLNGPELVIEAVVENMKIKKIVLADIEKNVSDHSIITSNTSSLSISDMSSALNHPGRFAGLHFFNPVNKMPLVEIVSHDKVDLKTIERLYQWCLDVKKVPIVVKDGPGFLVNRILAPFLNEAAYLLFEGVSIEDLEKAALNFGMPMGPCRLMDEIGLDVCGHVAQVMEKGLGLRHKACDMAPMLDAKLLGKKTNAGFYLYENGKDTAINPEVKKFLPQTNKAMDEIEIQMRLILPMINEAAYILDEKIVENAQSVDLGLIFGIGFPPFRGGALKYADSEGTDRIANAILDFSNKVSPDRFALSPYLKRLADSGHGFYSV